MEKYVHISFANSEAIFSDKKHLSVAVSKAASNLHMKYGIILTLYSVDTSSAVLKLSSKENLDENFSLGNHLRGVSAYLLKAYPDDYRDFLIGNRLLNFREIPRPEELKFSISFQDMVQEILNIYSSCDYDRIERIHEIIKH